MCEFWLLPSDPEFDLNELDDILSIWTTPSGEAPKKPQEQIKIPASFTNIPSFKDFLVGSDSIYLICCPHITAVTHSNYHFLYSNCFARAKCFFCALQPTQI